MIRKAIIVVLTLGALGTGVLWAASFWGINVQQLRDGWHSEIIVVNGNLILQCQSLKGRESTLARLAMPSGREWHWGSETRVVWPLIKDRSPRFIPWMYQTPSSMLASVPLYAVIILFATYPTIAFIRGPLRRWRRRRKGLCVNCDYNLTGNVSGVCPECGTKIEA